MGVSFIFCKNMVEGEHIWVKLQRKSLYHRKYKVFPQTNFLEGLTICMLYWLGKVHKSNIWILVVRKNIFWNSFHRVWKVSGDILPEKVLSLMISKPLSKQVVDRSPSSWLSQKFVPISYYQHKVLKQAFGGYDSVLFASPFPYNKSCQLQ